MEDREKKPDIPSNYVTLQQLKERWIKEQQRRQEQVHEQQDPEVAVADQVEEQQRRRQIRRGGRRNGVNPIRDYRRSNCSSRASSGGAHPEITDHGVTVAAIGEGSGIECTAAETKSAELVDKRKRKKWKKKNEEKGDLGREARALAIKSEKKNVPARSSGKVREIRMEYHPKMNRTVAESDSTVEVERKTEVVEDGGDLMTGIEQKFEDLALEKTKERSESQIEVNNRSSGANRGYNGVPNSGYRKNGDYKDRFNRGNRGGYGGFSHGTRRYGRHNAVSGKYKGGQGDQRVWVRKEEAAAGGDDSMDRSWGVSLQELE